MFNLTEEFNATCGQRPVYQLSLRDDSEVSYSYLVGGWILMGGFVIYTTVTTLLFWHYRKDSPVLQKRNLFLLCSSVFGSMLVGFHGIIRDSVGVHNFPCDVMLWMKGMGLAFLLGPIGLRLILFRNNLIRAKKLYGVGRKSGNIEGLEDYKTEDLANARYKTSTSFAILVLLVAIVLPYLILCLSMQFSLPYYNQGCTGCMDGTLELALIAGIGISQQLVFISQSHQLRFEKDPLGLLYEIKWACISSLWIGFIAVLLDFIDPVIGRPYDFALYSPDWLVPIALSFFHFYVCPLQIYLSFKPVPQQRLQSVFVVDIRRMTMKTVPRVADESAASQKMTLQEVLANPEVKELFNRYLITEFSTENILFYSSIENFKTKFDSLKDKQKTAENLFEIFCKAGAVMQVNLPSSIREELDDVIEWNEKPITADLFNAAQIEIGALMSRDSLPRFFHSEDYKQYCDRVKHSVSMAMNPTFEES